MNVIRRLMLLLTLLLATPAAWSQPKTSALPRLSNGKPDFNGIWQALSPANYDVERHMARPSLMLRQGPYGPLPAVSLLKLGAVGSTESLTKCTCHSSLGSTKDRWIST